MFKLVKNEKQMMKYLIIISEFSIIIFKLITVLISLVYSIKRTVPYYIQRDSLQMHFLPSRQNFFTHYNSPHNVYSSLMKRHHDLYKRTFEQWKTKVEFGLNMSYII